MAIQQREGGGAQQLGDQAQAEQESDQDVSLSVWVSNPLYTPLWYLVGTP